MSIPDQLRFLGQRSASGYWQALNSMNLVPDWLGAMVGDGPLMAINWPIFIEAGGASHSKLGWTKLGKCREAYCLALKHEC